MQSLLRNSDKGRVSINEFDLFPENLNFIVPNTDFIKELCNAVKSSDKGNYMYVSNNCYDREKDELIVLGILLDDVQVRKYNQDPDAEQKKLYNTYVNYMFNLDLGMKCDRNILTNAKLYHPDDATFKYFEVLNVKNENWNVSISNQQSREFDQRDKYRPDQTFYLSVSNPQLNMIREYNGTKINYFVKMNNDEFPYLIKNSVLGANATMNNCYFRFYKKSYPYPLYRSINAGYIDDRHLSDEYFYYNKLYSLIREDEYQQLSKRVELTHIFKNSKETYLPKNTVTSVKNLIPGHVYSFTEYPNMIRGYDTYPQFIYLGKIDISSKTDYPWVDFDQESNSKSMRRSFIYRDSTLNSLGGSMYFKGQDSAALVNRTEGSKMKLREEGAHVFVNLGQLARLSKNLPGSYITDPSEYSTVESFTDNFIKILKSNFECIWIYCRGRFCNDLRNWISRGHAYTRNGVHSLYSNLSNVAITLYDSLLKKEIKSNNSSLIDLGEKFYIKDSDAYLTNLFNKITETTLDLFSEHAISLHSCPDSVRIINNSSYSVLRDFNHTKLPFLAWVTPELFATNEKVAYSVIGHLKACIKYVSDTVFSAIERIRDIEEFNKKHSSEFSAKSRSYVHKRFIPRSIGSLSNFLAEFTEDERKELIEIAHKHVNALSYTSYNGAQYYPISQLYRGMDNSDFTDVDENLVKELNNLLKSHKTEFQDLLKDIKDLWNSIELCYADSSTQVKDLDDNSKDIWLKNNVEVMNKLMNVTYSWFAKIIHTDYKLNPKSVFRNTEFDWIDKFNLDFDKTLGDFKIDKVF